MLNRRTNVLLSEPDYTLLSRLASADGRTVGELIRQAIRKTYRHNNHLSCRKIALDKIRQLAKSVDTRGINYRQLIEDGRK